MYACNQAKDYENLINAAILNMGITGNEQGQDTKVGFNIIRRLNSLLQICYSLSLKGKIPQSTYLVD